MIIGASQNEQAGLAWAEWKLLHVCPLIKQSRTYGAAWICALRWSSSVTKMTVCGIKDPLLPLLLHPYWIALSMNYWPCSPDPPHYCWDCQAWLGRVGWPCWRSLSLMPWANHEVPSFYQASRQEACSVQIWVRKSWSSTWELVVDQKVNLEKKQMADMKFPKTFSTSLEY